MKLKALVLIKKAVHVYTCIIILLAGFGTTTTRGPMCYACDYQQTPESCRTIKQCGRDEVGDTSIYCANILDRYKLN